MRASRIAVLASLAAVPARAQMAHPAGMSHQQVVAAARAGGPPNVSDSATIGWIDATNGQFTQMQAGTNGFTCVIVRPDPIHGPVCGDRVAVGWLMAFLTGQPAPPPVTAPGVAYMAQGGSHWENADGTINLENDLTPQHTAGSHQVLEPAHWMLIYPMDPASGMATRDNHLSYIMFAGTPWAHMMIHQDPARMNAMRH